MKKIVISFAIACMAFIGSAKTLDEVKAEYTDGTTVYSFRYDGKGSNRLRYDTVKLPSGKVTILVVEEPESGYEKKQKKVNTVKEDDWSKNGSLVFATTNRHGVVRAVFQKNDDYVIKSKSIVDNTKKKVDSKKLLKSKILKADNKVTKKSIWQYTNDDIKKYVINDPTKTNLLLSAKKPVKKLLKAGTNTTGRIVRNRSTFDGDYDGGYYVMNDDTVISYRDALNQGWADLPTNSVQQAVFDDVTSDPDSLWTKRVIFHDCPLNNKRNKTHKSASKEFHIR